MDATDELRELPQTPVCMIATNEKITCILSWIIWLLGVVVAIYNLYFMKNETQKFKKAKNDSLNSIISNHELGPIGPEIKR